MKKLGLWSGALLVAALGAHGALAVEPIEKVEIGKNSEFRVNGKPFLPIMSWAQQPKRYEKFAALGINTHAGDGNPDAAKATNTYIFTNFKAEYVKSPYVLAWFFGDEPDMPKGKGADAKPRTEPEAVVAKAKEIKAIDPNRPLAVTFTGAFFPLDGKYSDEMRAKLYPEYIKAVDVVGFDIYPIYGSGHASHLNWVGQATATLKKLGGSRPVYAWIETSKGSKWMTYEKQPDVLPMHTRHEVWQALINGATAIGYFTHVWKPTFTELGATPEMQEEMKRINAQLTRLSAAILADPAPQKIDMKLPNEMGCQFKATTLDGATYIFALNEDLGPDGEKPKQFEPIHPRGGKAVFTVSSLKAGTVIEVVDEKRTVTAANGQFSDEFAPLAEHVYKFKP